MPRSFLFPRLSGSGALIVLVLQLALASPMAAQDLVVAWGDNSSGECNVPALPAGTSYLEVAAAGWETWDPWGWAHSPSYHGDRTVARRSDGLVVEWGYLVGGVPVLPAGLSYVEVAASATHTVARRIDGTVVAWGHNWSGQCNVPALPAGLSYVEIAAAGAFDWFGFAYGHTVARRSDGTVVAWGDNSYGQCNVPALPAGLRYVEVATSSGYDVYGSIPGHTVARRSDGTVIAWGSNSYGQCNVPALPAGLHYVEVAASSRSTAARRSDGMIVAWGNNSAGQCNVPALPAGLRYVEVAAGTYHMLARRSDGTVVAWGDNSLGQCNVPPLPAGSSFAAVSAGVHHSAAIVRSGSFETFGAGCPGSMPTATLSSLHLPRLGQSMLVQLDHLPQSAAILALGFANVTSPAGALPFDLAGHGMPGCSLRIRIDTTQFVQGLAANATYSLPIPNLASLAGIVLHQQALVWDAAAGNAAGAVMSDAVTAVIGS